ncbi:MAG: hypothetical protein COA79_05235 [Planctomycetota bacterium]|nr:MAG: hypothetical protein COA79_05235 [Planctomycetota bacterium]
MDRLEIYDILVKQHESMLLSYVYGYVNDFAIAEDLAQETFVKAYEKLDTLKNKQAFEGWLRSIAKNIALRYLQKNKNKIIFTDSIIEGYDEVFESIEENKGSNYDEKLRFLKECFNRLPDMLKETCKLHYFENLKSKDIALSLKLQSTTILKRLERGRVNLRECVERKLQLESLKNE